MLVNFLFLLSSLAGCAAGDPNGVWALQTPNLEMDADACTETLSHNFAGATEIPEDVAVDTSGLTETTSSESTGGYLLVAITVQGETAVMVVGNEAYPGTGSGAAWDFAWKTETTSTVTQTGEQGYSYNQSQTVSSSVSYTLSFDGDTVSGAVNSEVDSTAAATESDQWGDDVSSQLPASVYLEIADDQGNMRPARNKDDEAECSGDCSLSIVTACPVSGDITGTRTGFEVEEVADGVVGSGQSTR